MKVNQGAIALAIGTVLKVVWSLIL